MTMLEKRQPIRLTKLRDSAKGAECTVRAPCCNYNPETSVLAHYRSLDDGAGTRLKPDDTSACIACSDCHDWLDRRVRYPYDDEREWYWFRAMRRTWRFWVENGILA